MRNFTSKNVGLMPGKTKPLMNVHKRELKDADQVAESSTCEGKDAKKQVLDSNTSTKVTK